MKTLSKHSILISLMILFALVVSACAPAQVAATEEAAEEAAEVAEEVAKETYKVVIAPKLIGIAYYSSCFDGMEEAANELGNIEWEVQGPTEANAEKQIEMLDAIITTQPDAIILAANDPQALAPSMKRAMEAGIVVVTFDADTLPEARDYFVNQATFEGIGQSLVEEVVTQKGESAKFAIISSTPDAPNQNAWIEEMKKYMASDYPNLELLTIQYGEDNVALSKQKADDILRAYPEVEAIVEPSDGGCPGLAQSIEANGKTGVVAGICLATPKGMREYVKKGVVPAVILWNTVDLGYLSMYVTEAMLTGKLKHGDKTVSAGRLGTYDISDTNEIVLGPGFRFDKDNIDQFDF